LADEPTPEESAAADDSVTPDETATPEPEPATEPEPEPEPELDPVVASLLERLSAELGDAILGFADSFGTLVVRIRPDAWRQAGEVAKRSLSCDYLAYIAGVDWMPAPKADDEDSGDTSTPAQPTEMTFGIAGSAGRFQVLAHVQSTTKHWGITLKADVDEQSPHLASWVPVYAGADWHERECWEMYGIVFDGHPSLRHLYLPAEFEGHPLRKDFPLLARDVKPWPGLVDVEPMPEDEPAADATAEVGESA
jgi:NADH-quinone oxidoreductase subunit C